MGNATFTQAVLNVINIVTGVGLLSVPFALKRAGWAGLGILWVLGFIMNYTGSPSTRAEMHLARKAKGTTCVWNHIIVASGMSLIYVVSLTGAKHACISIPAGKVG